MICTSTGSIRHTRSERVQAKTGRNFARLVPNCQIWVVPVEFGTNCVNVRHHCRVLPKGSERPRVSVATDRLFASSRFVLGVTLALLVSRGAAAAAAAGHGPASLDERAAGHGLAGRLGAGPLLRRLPGVATGGGGPRIR